MSEPHKSIYDAFASAMREAGFTVEAEAFTRTLDTPAKAEPSREWHATEPGVLALLGTRWRIEYHPSRRRPDYWLYEDQRLIHMCEYVETLKQAAEHRQKELDSMDAG